MVEELSEVPLRGKVRKISRAFYLLVPITVVNELDIKDNDKPVILLDKKNRILAFRFKE